MRLDLGGPFAWSTPTDVVRWTAVVAGTWLFASRVALHPVTVRRLERLAPFAAALLSWGYVVYYLRGGPRIIDATAYLLEARTLAEGRLTLPLGDDELSILGRFLLRTRDGSAASVLFPPGWPAVLALGVRLGVPLAVGPCLAAALTVASASLARLAAEELTDGARASLFTSERADRAAAAASLVSVGSAALRYHTADTMSHGWAATCFAVALLSVVRAARTADARWSGLAGLGAGWLFATRPTSALALVGALAIGFATGWAGDPRRLVRPTSVVAIVVGAAAPLALWFTYQHAATGSWLATAQGRYYAVSDGPAGCFRYGFGAGVGCLGEHAEFVEHRLRDGFGLAAALGTTGRRCLLHATDTLNFGPLALLVVLGVLATPGLSRLLGVAVVAQIVAYAPFYFDGSYPGGGGRMLADVLPLEHALVGLALATMGPRRGFECWREPDLWSRRLRRTLGVMALGFAVGVGADHEALRDREGGRPMFLLEDLRAAATVPELVFVDTDHGFDLAYRAGALVARRRGDDLDRLVWEAHGRPAAVDHRYGLGGGLVTLTPRTFDPRPTSTLPLRLEGESLWPPLEQAAGWAWPTWRVPPCASAQWGLELRGQGAASVAVALPRAARGRHVVPVVAVGASAGGRVVLMDGDRTLTTRDLPASSEAGCIALGELRVPHDARAPRLLLEGRNWALDVLHLSEIH